jgi:flagellar hook-associated protein 3 FlgL
MRVTGSRLMDMSAAVTAKNQEALASASEQVSSGKRVLRPSDDPVAYAAAQRANVRKLVTGGATSAMQVAQERLAETDAALATIGDAVSQARALAVQGANDSYDATARRELGLQVRGLFEGALAAANAQSSDGEYLLAGSNSLARPFDASGAYQGDASARALGGSFTTVAGSSLTAASGVDVLPVLSRLAAALEANDKAGITTALGELDTATKQVNTARTRGGAASSVLEGALAANEQLDVNLANQISNHVEIDAIDAATSLAKTTQALEASRVVSSHIATLLDPRMMGL